MLGLTGGVYGPDVQNGVHGGTRDLLLRRDLAEARRRLIECPLSCPLIWLAAAEDGLFSWLGLMLKQQHLRARALSNCRLQGLIGHFAKIIAKLGAKMRDTARPGDHDAATKTVQADVTYDLDLLRSAGSERVDKERIMDDSFA